MKPLALLSAVAILAGDVAASAIDFSVGSMEVIYTAKQRKSKGLNVWPDGNMGVVNLGNGQYEFYSANASNPVRTIGTLENPAPSKMAKKSVKINNVPKKTFNYVAGGPIYQDPSTGAKLLLYHAEKHIKGMKDYYTVLGLAVATDPTGTNFVDLGTIVEPNVSINNKPHSIDMGGGSFAVFDDHLHVYYRDYLANGTSAELAVARASLSDVLNNALAKRGTQFTKYFDGGWSEPGRGGRSSALEIGNPYNAWSSVSYNDYLGGLVMVSAQPSATHTDLYMATSADGINWSPRQGIAVDPGEQFYPTIVGTGADASRSGQSFYVYYTDSAKGAWNRKKDAQLVRRMVTLDPSSTPGFLPELPSDEPPLPMEWLAVSDFQDDFRTGSPTDGWSYMWNPTGKLGNAAAFAPLVWSDAAQAYNTTGGATSAPANKQTHADDYLHFTGWGGGHPGQPGYMPIVGYTIQEEDGAGAYRLVESSIAKHDAITSKGEDGLQVMVYVNNMLVGSTTSVSTSGALASFDRLLGELNVGDTVWVAVNAGANQYYDSFVGFDFSIVRGVPLEMMATMAMGVGGLAGSMVPEPNTAVSLLMAAALVGRRKRRRECCVPFLPRFATRYIPAARFSIGSNTITSSDS